MADVLFRTSSSHTSFFDRKDDCGAPLKKSFSFTNSPASSHPSSHASSTLSASTSSLSLETSFDDLSSDDDTLTFPSYGYSPTCRNEEESEAPPSSPIVPNTTEPVPLVAPSPSEPSTLVATPDPLPISEDDTAVRPEPSHHVDYLSHEWKEEDIWASWRHIVEHRRVYGERSRLENASWRTWAKQQFKLKTTSPESLNWLKDVDITWLYGPLQPASHRTSGPQTSTPSSRLSKTNSFLHKKPILKKRSMSEVMLQKSISSSSLVKEAAAAVQAQQAHGVTLERRRRPFIGRAKSDFAPSTTPFQTMRGSTTDFFSSQSTSGLQTPDPAEKKHIRFDEKVEQCIAVDCKGMDDEDEDDFNNQNPWAKYSESSDSSDEGVVMMKKSRKKRPLSRTSSKTNISGDSKTIAKLPSTTLKYRTDSPDITDQQQHHSLGFWRSSRLSPSPSQETLRPSNPSTNFLLPDDDEEEDETNFTFGVKRSSTPTQEPEGGLRRTASGMFMPFEDEGEEATQPGLIGKVVDTVNTARDIAHVIWNVGWRN